MKKLIILITLLSLITPVWASDLSFILTIKGKEIEMSLEEIRELKKTLDCIIPKQVGTKPITFWIEDQQWVITPDTLLNSNMPYK